MTARTYVCASCRRQCESAWTEEEAWEERQRLWSDYDDEEMVIICDDCFQMAEAKRKALGIKRYSDARQDS